MNAYIDDPDFTLHVGDALETLQAMPAESVHCCVTSPPYWGLRDYSTDGQLGLEASPDEYVTSMVNVFREVRRVLRADGTLWLNIGDSYANSGAGGDTRSGFNSRYFGTDIVPGKQAAAVGQYPAEARDHGLKPKDLVGIPWRLAFALQADGWYLRSDIIWSKPNPMPESVTDRPTKAHEYLFLLTKSPRYFYDADAIREPVTSEPSIARNGSTPRQTLGTGSRQPGNARVVRELVVSTEAGRNKRSVWEIATEAYPDAHFATFPQALVEPCIKAGCPEWVCATCGKPRERITEVSYDETSRTPAPNKGHLGNFLGEKAAAMTAGGFVPNREKKIDTLGWSDCGHNNYQPGTVLDPFLGSGTTAQVARRLGRRCVGIELNPEYAQLAARRLQQQSLFA